MNNLAVLYQLQGRYDEAGQLLERAIAITERARGTEDARYPIYIHSLGELLLATGKLEEAERQLRRALGIYELRGHRFRGLALYQLAGISARQDQPERALGLLRQALEQGWADRSILDDSNLNSLRGRPEFEAIVSEVESRIKDRKRQGAS
jgi:tetratricopeptide (TPR) repeat protein